LLDKFILYIAITKLMSLLK